MASTLAACGASGKAFVASTPAPDHGLIYIYRQSHLQGGGASFYVSANGVRIGTLKNGGYINYEARPGNVTFAIALRTLGPSLITIPEKELITVPVEPGEVYYVRFKMSTQVMELVDESTGLKETHDLKSCEEE
jgi:hypothetical protein